MNININDAKGNNKTQQEKFERALGAPVIHDKPTNEKPTNEQSKEGKNGDK